MFRTVKRLSEALECLTSATEALRESVVVARDWHAEHGNVEARLEELERERHLFESEVHGELLKAQAEYRKAGNAEKRAQTAAAAGLEFGNGTEEGASEFMERYTAWARTQHDQGGEDGAVPIVPGPVENAPSVVESLKANRRSR